MNCSKLALGLYLVFVPLQCTTDNSSKIPNSTSVAFEHLKAFPISTKRLIPKKRTGRLETAVVLPDKYNKTNLSQFLLPHIDSELKTALNQQLTLLKRRTQKFNQNFGDLSLNLVDLETTIQLLLLWQETYPQGLAEHLNAYQLNGEDGKGNVYFTGYYTPEIKVNKNKNKVFKHPIYSYPKKWKGQLPTRREIDGAGVLKGKGLEIAYAQRLEDIYYMQLQGSGMVSYPNGNYSYFGFAGSNRRPYSSIGTHIKNNENIRLRNISMTGVKNYLRHHPNMVEPILFTNKSYVFFKESKTMPIGAGHVPLTADYSIAVDTKHLPLGSCLLAALPILNEKGKFSHHEYRFLVAQDVGGRINGNGHVDVYCGVGEKGKKKAMALHHFGQLWLLLPKPSDELGPVFSEEILTLTN